MSLEELMTYTREQIESILRQGCKILRDTQPMLFDIKANINERTVSGELAVVIRDSFLGLHVNCEYNRMTDEHGNQIPKRIGLDPNDSDPSSVYPDVIVHRQEDGNHNLLVVEIKMSWKNNGKENDANKLHRYVEELGYKFALYLEFGVDGIQELIWIE